MITRFHCSSALCPGRSTLTFARSVGIGSRLVCSGFRILLAGVLYILLLSISPRSLVGTAGVLRNTMSTNDERCRGSNLGTRITCKRIVLAWLAAHASYDCAVDIFLLRPITFIVTRPTHAICFTPRTDCVRKNSRQKEDCQGENYWARPSTHHCSIICHWGSNKYTLSSINVNISSSR